MNKSEINELKKLIKSVQAELAKAEHIIETYSVNNENTHTIKSNSKNIIKIRKVKLEAEEALHQWIYISNNINDNTAVEKFRDFLRSLTTDDLAIFIKINRLPVNSKMRKEQVTNGIMQLLKAGQAIQQTYSNGKQSE